MQKKNQKKTGCTVGKIDDSKGAGNIETTRALRSEEQRCLGANYRMNDIVVKILHEASLHVKQMMG